MNIINNYIKNHNVNRQFIADLVYVGWLYSVGIGILFTIVHEL